MMQLDEHLAEGRAGVVHATQKSRTGGDEQTVRAVMARSDRRHRRAVISSATAVFVVVLVSGVAVVRAPTRSGDVLDVESVGAGLSDQPSMMTGLPATKPERTVDVPPASSTASVPGTTLPEALPSTTETIGGPTAPTTPTTAAAVVPPTVPNPGGPPGPAVASTSLPAPTTAPRRDFSGPGLPGSPAVPREAYARWLANEPTDYTLVLRTSGIARVGTFEITVQGRLATRILDLHSGEVVDSIGPATVSSIYDAILFEWPLDVVVSEAAGLSVNGVFSEMRVDTFGIVFEVLAFDLA